MSKKDEVNLKMRRNQYMNHKELEECIADLQQKCFEIFWPISENMQQWSFEIWYWTISFKFHERKSENE